jgi:hypothetical protein
MAVAGDGAVRCDGKYVRFENGVKKAAKKMYVTTTDFTDICYFVRLCSLGFPE